MAEGPSRAVFLSYSREDAAAARRIAEALRSNGIEVWFDENELRGGDAWDQKIRRQIKECGLFLAVISLHTQERGEGYFRLEWKLAVERTGLMMEGVPFLVPVVVDGTPESSDMVPEVFTRVQWTRLPGALPTPQFVEQVRNLLDSPRRPAPAAGRAGLTFDHAAAGPPTRKPWPWKPTAMVGSALAIGITVTLLYVDPKGRPTASPTQTVAMDAPPQKSIAVLPFAHLSADKEDEILADGIHLELLTNLGNLRDLQVASRPAVSEYRRTEKKGRQIGEELGVAHLLTGDVQRDGKKVRVTVQLVNTRTDRLVWTPSPYTRDLEDRFALQSEIAQAIARELDLVISPEEMRLIERRPTDNLRAYDLYVQANQPKSWSRWGDYGWEKGRERLLQEAVQLDPKFAVAWAALAAVQAVRMGDGYDVTDEYAKAAEQAIETAMRLEPDSPQVLRHRAEYLYRRWDYTGATELCERLLRQRPGDAYVLWLLGIIHRRQGNLKESHPLIIKAARLDPGNREYADNLVANLLWGMRRYPEAIAEQRRIVERFPGSLEAAFHLARLAFLATGSTSEMKEFFAKLPAEKAQSKEVVRLRRDWARMSGDFAEAAKLDRLEAPASEVAVMTLAAIGDSKGMRSKLEPLPDELRAQLKQEPRNPWAWVRLGKVESLLGNKDEALRCLTKAKEAVPDSRDVGWERWLQRVHAEVLAWTGDHERAVVEYRVVLANSTWLFNVHELRHGIEGVPLRDYAPFQALVDDPKNNAPLF